MATFGLKPLHDIRQVTSPDAKNPQKLEEHQSNGIHLLSAQVPRRFKHDTLKHAEKVILGYFQSFVHNCVDSCLNRAKVRRRSGFGTGVFYSCPEDKCQGRDADHRSNEGRLQITSV